MRRSEWHNMEAFALGIMAFGVLLLFIWSGVVSLNVF
jgi:hypothetical protein